MQFTGFVSALGIALALTGCGPSEETSGQGGSGGQVTTTGGSGGSGGTAGGAPIVDPALFDCTASKPPVRTNSIPTACATDPTCTTKLVSGHRAAGGELGVIAPEDTVAAVNAAVVLGIDFVETDPRPTKDGVLINLHDPTVDRTTFGTGEAAQMTLAEIQALELKTSEYAGDFSCARIPTFEEVLTAAKGKVHVLVDANKTDQVALLVEAIQKTDTLEWAIFDTDSVEKIDQALALEPALLTMIRVADLNELNTELAHFAAHPPVIVEVHDGADGGALTPAIHDANNRALVDVFVTDVGAGLSDDPSLYDEAWAPGFDMLQTDRPDLVLRNLGRWPPAPQP
ncbi:MAG: glycerophosphodiester phosphodiesterase family protein [Polyangiaceae bacterium]|nr:glycerophosphodiester phosphodiesterase family protein [Polyangiaceae bacterium]